MGISINLIYSGGIMGNLISCDLHDYFEIVCMHQSTVTVTMQNNTVHTGQAKNIVIKNKQELLELNVLKQVVYLKLTDIKHMCSAQDNIDIKIN